MTTIAPSWDNDHFGVSGPHPAVHGQEGVAPQARNRYHGFDLCNPAVAATITADAQQLIQEQVTGIWSWSVVGDVASRWHELLRSAPQDTEYNSIRVLYNSSTASLSRRKITLVICMNISQGEKPARWLIDYGADM